MQGPAGAGPSGDRAPAAGEDVLGESVRDAARTLSPASDVTLFAHVNPDADALGSALALGMALRRRGAAVRVSFGSPHEVPRALRDLDVEGCLVPAESLPEASQLVVVLDTGSAERLGKLAEHVERSISRGGRVLVVDHHVANTRFGTQHLIDEGAEATVLLVLRLLDELGVQLDEALARCVYAGLVTDTRSFRNASAPVHRVAARLLEAGVEPEALARRLMDTHPFAWQRMVAGVLAESRLEREAAGGLGFAHATIELARWEGLPVEELDSVIDVVRTAAEAEVTAVFKELEPNRFAVSLRAESRVDVGWAAAACGGGGHRLASGFTDEGPVEQLLARLRRALDEAPLLD